MSLAPSPPVLTLVEPIEPRGLVGSTLPRLSTPPLAPAAGWAAPRGRVCACGCGLSEATSRGWEVIDFAETLGVWLLPWQRWLLVHGLELRRGGGFRFRTLLVLVARQNGKTTLLKVLALWRMWCDGPRAPRMVLGTSTKLEYAKESWRGAIELADGYDRRRGWPERNPRHGRPADVNFAFPGWEPEGTPPPPPRPAAAVPESEQDALPGLQVRHQVAPTGRRRQVGTVPCMARNVREGVSDTEFILTNGSRYKIATANRDGGRSLSVDLAIVDELREHKTYDAWAAIDGTTTARPDPQTWALSNAGDDTSVVLNDQRGQGLATIADPESDPAFGLFEWSAPEDCAILDRAGWQAANPAMGYTITEDTLLAKSRRPAPVFRTEHLCQRVESGNPAVSRDGWRAGADEHGTMDRHRGRVTLVLDAAPDCRHITLVAAADEGDGRVRLETVAAWTSAHLMRADRVAADGTEEPSLATWVARIKPAARGWFPQGPAAALRVDLEGWTEIAATQVPGLCQAFAELVESRRVLHSDDPVLNTQVMAATRTPAGDGGWRFARKGVGHVDAVYAAAGAVHLARTAPPPKGKPRIILPTGV